jgi:hypothetical protein
LTWACSPCVFFGNALSGVASHETSSASGLLNAVRSTHPTYQVVRSCPASGGRDPAKEHPSAMVRGHSPDGCATPLPAVVPPAGRWTLKTMSPRDDLAEQREQWITTICTGLVGAVDEHPALDPVWIVPELGDVRLVRALLVGQIAALAASGCSSGDIGGLLAASPAFVAPRPEREQLTDLANKIRWYLVVAQLGDLHGRRVGRVSHR